MGFMTADLLAERWSVNFSDHKGLAMLGKGIMNLSGRNVKFFLAKPLTYMNDSGNAVASISSYYQIEPNHIVVVHDDMDLDFGRLARRNTPVCVWVSAMPNAVRTPTTIR